MAHFVKSQIAVCASSGPGLALAYRMKTTKKVRRMGIAGGAIALLLGLAACASGIKYSQLPSNADPGKELETLNQQAQQAEKEQLGVYAPESYEHAVSAWNDAKKARGSNADNQDILDDIAKSRAYFSRASERSKAARSALGEVSDARDRAIEAGAPKWSTTSKQFADADAKLRDFTMASDQNGQVKARADETRAELLGSFQEVELKALEEKNLGRAQAQIETARNEGAEKWAPRALSVAEAKYAEGVATIKRDRKNVAGIAAVSTEAVRRADYLLEVTREAKASTTKLPEDIAAAKLGSSARIADLQQDKSRMSEEQKRLEAETRLTSTVRMAQSKFKGDEAQVYEDGKQVHIRLKALKFPSGSSTIQTSAYPLLGRVKEVLKETQPAEVRIDGRTDSLGSKKLNAKLSKARAESVKEFLAVSTAIDPSKVTTEGFDYQKPVASGKTDDGRALNRGVDVILTPASDTKEEVTGITPAG